MKFTSLLLALGAVSGAAFAQTATPNSQQGAPKMLCLFLDLTSMSPAEQAKAQQAASQFIQDKVAPTDLIEIATYTSKLNIIQDFTGDHDALLAALKNLPAVAAGGDSGTRIEAVQAATASLSRSQGQGGLVWVTAPAGSPNYMAALNALRFNANPAQPVGVSLLPIQP